MLTICVNSRRVEVLSTSSEEGGVVNYKRWFSKECRARERPDIIRVSLQRQSLLSRSYLRQLN